MRPACVALGDDLVGAYLQGSLAIAGSRSLTGGCVGRTRAPRMARSPHRPNHRRTPTCAPFRAFATTGSTRRDLAASI